MTINTALKVTPESLEQQAGVVDATVEDIASQIKTMQQALSSTSYWKGAAADLHHKDLTSRQQQIAALLKRLGGYPTKIRTIAGTYKGAERGNKALSGQLPADVIQ